MIAPDIHSFLSDGIFVAHNISFDYNIIKRELAEIGIDFHSKKLCTVKLARKFIPGHDSYSLGNICSDLGISIENRHRAYGDAAATVKLFSKILVIEGHESVVKTVIEEKERKIPRHIDQDLIAGLPQGQGVYFLKSSSGKIQYIGKSKNIRNRVISHLQSRKILKGSRLELRVETTFVDFMLIENDFVCSLIEAFEIKKHRPAFNRSYNRVNFRYAVKPVLKEKRLVLKATSVIDRSINSALMYKSRSSALRAINEIYQKAFGVCLEVPALFSSFKDGLNIDIWNERLQKILKSSEYPAPDLMVSWDLKDGKGKVVLEINDNFMEGISWYDNEGEVYKKYSLDEDPDLKRMVVKKIREKKHKINFL